MMQNDNVKNWVDCWQSSNGFFRNTSDNEQAESWNRRWDQKDGMAERLNHERKQKRMEEIFALLDEAGFQVEGARVLDIGSGPGATSIPFARAGAEVTSLDISSTALDRLRAEAEKEGLSIETKECSWWSADIDELGLRNRFDLVFVTSTPAVKDAECFDRMIGCSRNYCYYSFSLGKGGHMQMDHREALRKVLDREPPRRTNMDGKGSLFMNGFMYLYLTGYRPLVKINHHHREVEVGWEEAAERAIKGIERREECTEETKSKVRDYYRESAADGKIRTVSDGYSGMMVWNVNL